MMPQSLVELELRAERLDRILALAREYPEMPAQSLIDCCPQLEEVPRVHDTQSSPA